MDPPCIVENVVFGICVADNTLSLDVRIDLFLHSQQSAMRVHWPTIAKAMHDPHDIRTGSIAKLPCNVRAIRVAGMRWWYRPQRKIGQPIAKLLRKCHRTFG
uniref:Tiorf81 protein n=1 Tax=Agrobacterium tumefaciens TaxID=358 RepID=Q9R6H8_AGRTU|nr:tiorf81 [Agrobacterium tumefaciens]